MDDEAIGIWNSVSVAKSGSRLSSEGGSSSEKGEDVKLEKSAPNVHERSVG